MKYNVGYSLSDDGSYDFLEIVKRYKEHINEVYFPWLDIPSGRASLTNSDGFIDWSVQEKLISDLKQIKLLGIRLDLLYNANCFGDDAMSEQMQNTLISVIDYLNYVGCPIDVITTTSPAVAHIVKTHRSHIEVRASVNMRIGTVKGMQYLAHLFDSFYIQRDYNRDLERIKELKAWADKNGKKLYMLANSGCMAFCSCQTFHDNAVAHSNGIASKKNIEGFHPHSCWHYLRDAENWVSLLQNTWVRPEDIHNYEGLFDSVKLATRMHQLPALVIDSYVREKYSGNLLDLFEPGFGPAIAPYVFNNSAFPEDFFEKTSKCDKKCHTCSYCRMVLDKILIKDWMDDEDEE